MTLRNRPIDIGVVGRGYQLLTTLATPLVAAGFACSARGRIRMCERFGSWEKIEVPVDWWFHGASVGEVQGLDSVFRLLRAVEPDASTLLSCTSPTGLARGKDLARYHRILPFDAPLCVRRALDRTPCERLVLTETELWPELLRQALTRGIRCSIINGRISDYTVQWYRRLRALIAPLVARMEHVCVPDEVQRERYVELGVPAQVVHVTGHTKYDTECTQPTSDERIELRRTFFPDIAAGEPIIVLGSARPGEERFWIDAVRAVRDRGTLVRLIIAPRHAEKFGYFWDQVVASGIPARRWSDGVATVPGAGGILVLDAMGVLHRAYAASDLAFIGATLVDIGGHNPMEAAMFGTPVCVGPYTSVIESVVADLERGGGVARVANGSDVARLVEQVAVGDPSLRKLGENARKVWQHHRGATERVLSVLRS